MWAGRADDAVIADEREDGVVEIFFLARLLHELANAPVEVGEATVFVKRDKSLLIQLLLCGRARFECPQVCFRNGIRPVIAAGLDIGEEWLSLRTQMFVCFQKQILV